MKLAFICDFNPFIQSSAIANRYEGLLNGLLKCGVTVDIFINSINDLSDLYIQYDRIGNLKILYFGTKKFCGTTKFRLLKDMIFGNRLNDSAEHVLFKVLSSDYDYIWIAAGSAIRRSVLQYGNSIKPKLFMEFSEFQQLYKDDSVFFLRKWQYYNEYVVTKKLLKKHISYVAVMTKVLEPYYRQLTSSTTKYIHLPMTVNLERFKHVHTLANFKKPYIAFCGTYTNLKDGVLILIKAFEKLKDLYPNLSLFLAGFFHPDQREQQKYIQEHQLENRIQYCGVLTKDQIPSFIVNASLLVLSRPDSHQAQGGFPTKLGEYLATGNPVCVTKVGEIPDYLEDNVSAFMAEPGDVDSFADAMDRALRDPENARKVGLRGKRVAETEFNAEIQAKRLHEFLQENM